ncbi:MAG: hypothetical protein P3W96_003810 [Halomonas sp.]|nr:hypothetical protein [Halomonas sp.]MDM7481126.1 hypothetical protein [Halomonas sp.]
MNDATHNAGANVANIVSTNMSARHMLWVPSLDNAVALDDVVIANIAESELKMPAADFSRIHALACPCCRAMVGLYIC